MEQNIPQNNKISIDLEKYYGVFYDTGWFIGRELSIENQKIKIKFLKLDSERYVWPKSEDIQFLDEKFVLYGPVNLYGNGHFTIKIAAKQKIDKQFKSFKVLHG